MKTKLNDLFDKLEPEKGNILDEKIKLEEIDLDFEHLIHVARNVHRRNHYETVIGYFRRNIRTCTSKQITKFSTMLTNELVYSIGSVRAGEFLSYLVNNSKDSTHLIFTNQLNEKLNYLGEKLSDTVLHIQGDLGTYVGYSMKSGKITVEGNCGYRAGIRMKGGKIIIKGDVEMDLGKHMRGGIIEVHGDIGSLSNNINDGDIYHKDRLIVKDGKILDSSYKSY